jgi:nitric oxide synthase oxygenase domain/subunit
MPWRDTPRSVRRVFWTSLIVAALAFVGLAWLFLAFFVGSN